MAKRTYRRVTKYNAALNVNMTQEMREALENLADQYGISVVEMARRGISHALHEEATNALEKETTRAAQMLSDSDEAEARRMRVLDETDKLRRERILREVAALLHAGAPFVGDGHWYPDRNVSPQEYCDAVKEATRLGLDDVVTLLTAKHRDGGDDPKYHYLAFALVDIDPEEYLDAAKERLMSYYRDPG